VADLKGANLEGANLEGTLLEGVKNLPISKQEAKKRNAILESPPH
jgi:uncharacterized protein YjbI with pentapeptide repeats